MDVRELLIDGIGQLGDWMDDALKDLSKDQLNWLPAGKTVSAGFNAWHIMRTQDNITNFVFQRKNPIWVEGGYFEKFGLPKVDQGTGMGLDDARALTINDAALLREYGRAVQKDTVAYLQTVDPATFDEMQMIRPLGEMPRARVFRQVVMTHGFMHLGEINSVKGQLGLQFFI
jgi:hypothetical protein